MKPIVAFLQNMWVLPRQVATVSRWAATSQERERMIHYALFAGCLTGRRLVAAFGEDLCREIIWQEASPTVASNPRTYYPPDLDHVRAVLTKHSPRTVICFTRSGEAAIRSVLPAGVEFVAALHPAARGADTIAKLKAVAGALRERC